MSEIKEIFGSSAFGTPKPTGLIERVLRLVENKNTEHEWLKMSDHEIMVSAGLYEKDFVNLQRYNNAPYPFLALLTCVWFTVYCQYAP